MIGKNNHCVTNLYQCTLEGLYVQLTITSKKKISSQEKSTVVLTYLLIVQIFIWIQVEVLIPLNIIKSNNER